MLTAWKELKEGSQRSITSLSLYLDVASQQLRRYNSQLHRETKLKRFPKDNCVQAMFCQDSPEDILASLDIFASRLGK